MGMRKTHIFVWLKREMEVPNSIIFCRSDAIGWPGDSQRERKIQQLGAVAILALAVPAATGDAEADAQRIAASFQFWDH